MTRTCLAIALGALVGVASHLAYMRHREPVGTATIDGQLAWMRNELQLDDVQYARIRELHEASHPRLRAMSAELDLLRIEFAEFERARRTSDRVDFVEFARFVEARRELNRRCADSTRQLVLAAAELMTPPQRKRYLHFVATAAPPGAGGFN